MVPFGGWEMPVQYPAGVLAEHHAVRNAVGLFDIGHMGQVDVQCVQHRCRFRVDAIALRWWGAGRGG
ncbi:MAG: hypothetical protein EBT47_07205 [Chloroflexi bacterium]|nr:hypothetical protein [Chloroflexota bacterium]